MNRGKYVDAVFVFELIMDTGVTVVDENTGDDFILSLDEMVKEKFDVEIAKNYLDAKELDEKWKQVKIA